MHACSAKAIFDREVFGGSNVRTALPNLHIELLASFSLYLQVHGTMGESSQSSGGGMTQR